MVRILFRLHSCPSLVSSGTISCKIMSSTKNASLLPVCFMAFISGCHGLDWLGSIFPFLHYTTETSFYSSFSGCHQNCSCHSADQWAVTPASSPSFQLTNFAFGSLRYLWILSSFSGPHCCCLSLFFFSLTQLLQQEGNHPRPVSSSAYQELLSSPLFQGLSEVWE